MASIIEVTDLRYSYPAQAVDTIRGISFSITNGEIFGFLGPSGSGKSTTQKLLIGLLRNYGGKLHILGKAGSDWNHQLYYRIGVGFELPNHFSKLTGLENLQLFASFYGTGREGVNSPSPAALLDLVGLNDAARQRVGEYSKGMKMRLNFARALLNDPEVLFLDEPTAGLDPVTARKIKDIILDLRRQGKTIFLTTHNMHDADELCDRVAFIVAGELRLIGMPRLLKREYGHSTVRVTSSSKSETVSKHHHEFALATLGENREFLQLIKEARVETIHSQEATLEEVFIKTTGAKLI